MALSPDVNWLNGLTLQISLTEKNTQNSPKTLFQDSEVVINIPAQSPETSDTEATFHTPPKDHPLWNEGSVGSATQLLEGRKPTFVTCLLERTCSLSNIFHPDYLIRERHPVFQERRLSLQSDSVDCSFYVVDLYYKSLVKLRQESQIPPPI